MVILWFSKKRIEIESINEKGSNDFLHYLDTRYFKMQCNIDGLAILDLKGKIFDCRKNSNEIFKNLKIPSDTFQTLKKTEKILSILF